MMKLWNRNIIYLSAHMSKQRIQGKKIDIVKLNEEIVQIVAREQVLRDEIDKIIAEIEVE